MKYNLKGSTSDNILEVIFENRNVDFNNIEGFLYPGEESVMHPSVYINMDKAVDKIIEHIEKKSTILVVVDSDTDGYCSNAMLISYINNAFEDVDINYMIHRNKAHGFTKDVIKEVYETKCDLVIMADAGSNDYNEHKELHEMGVEIVILDHHECEGYSDYAIVVNNQLQDNANKTLSGGGVVMKFLEQMDERLNISLSENYFDLCAMALVADSMVMTEPETRYYVLKGLYNLNNDLIYTVLGTKSSVAFSDISYSFAPLVNAIIRVGEQSDKELLFEVLMGIKKEMVLNIRGKGDVEMDLATYITKIADRAKRLQNKLVNELMEDIDFKIHHSDLPIVVGIVPEDFNTSLSGLVANRLSDAYCRPSLVLRNNDGVFYGSARANEGFNDFKEYLLGTDRFEFCEGHQGAFGVGIATENLDLLLQDLKGKQISTNEVIHLVDKSYTNESITPFDIMALQELKMHWSKGFEKPLFHIKLNGMTSKNISFMGKNKDTVKINYKNIGFIKFKCDTYELGLFRSPVMDIELIGEFDINEWNGNSFPQVIIRDFEIVQKVENTLNFFDI